MTLTLTLSYNAKYITQTSSQSDRRKTQPGQRVVKTIYLQSYQTYRPLLFDNKQFVLCMFTLRGIYNEPHELHCPSVRKTVTDFN